MLAAIKKPAAPAHQSGLTVEERVQMTVDVMRRQFKAPLSVQELAALTGWSRSHYADVFKRLMGCSVLQYSIRLRMEHAAEMVESHDQTIRQIARRVGFKDALYFSRQFRRVHGVAPTVFRSQRRNQAITT